MTITREQAADLREGDVVELRDAEWPGVTITGPLVEKPIGLCIGHYTVIRWANGEPNERRTATLTVISRAPRPLYVNHDRTEPVAGDVVREEDPQGATTWLMDSFRTWQSADSTHDQDRGFDWPLRLLVDGTTGEVVE